MKPTINMWLHILDAYGRTSTDEASTYLSEFKEIQKTLNCDGWAIAFYMMKAASKLYALTLNQNNKISAYEQEIIKLRSDIEVLRANPNTPNGELAINRTKNKETHPRKKAYVNTYVINELKACNLTDEEIAKQLNVSRSTIWRRQKEAKQK